MGSQTYSRLTLGMEQLDTAIWLFLEHNAFASVITLAGAAEEVLGRALVGRGQQPALESNFAHFEIVHALLHKTKLIKKDFVREQNRVRDALKHYRDPAEPTIAADLQEAACWMIVRACENAHRLGLDVPRFDAFNDWFYENVVGI